MHYATADGTAVAGSDYTAVTGTLTFSTAVTVRTISVPVLDDQDHEHTETFTVTLSVPVNATLSSTGRTATGTIDDNDLPPRISIDDATLTEGSSDEPMHFTVSLDRAAGGAVTVDYATADDTAAAGSDYTTASGTLTIPSGSTAQTISVTILADSANEDTETFTVTLSNPTGVTLSDATATGTIVDPAPLALELSTLQVTGGSGAMYPEFSPDTLHYALTCTNSTTLDITAQALRTTAQLTLLRADTAQNVVATGTLATAIMVDQDDDIAIELSDAGETAVYVVNCIPADLPEVRVLTKTDRVSDGLLMVTPTIPGTNSYMMILDNNGVPRFHRHIDVGTNTGGFRRHPDGRYSLHRNNTAVRLYNSRMAFIESVGVVAPLKNTNGHDFLIAPNGNYLFISYHRTSRNLCDIDDYCDPGETIRMGTVIDGVIQEVDTDGREVFRWNTWDHVNMADCIYTWTYSEGDYSHLNSLHLVDGDIVASLRNCHQVVRIDRSAGTGAVEWQVGGSDPPRDPGAAYLEIVGDEDGHNEFCKQHSATITASGSLLLFDNGVDCRGKRKGSGRFTRVVEYDISSGSQAVFHRQYVLPSGHGYSRIRGSVRELRNGNWLIAWGDFSDATVPPEQRVVVSEVDSFGTAVLELNMFHASTHTETYTYRAYREREADIDIPWDLP